MSKDIELTSEVMGFLEHQGDVRASYKDRERIMTHLRIAHKDGRLTGDQFHSRVEQANQLESQAKLAHLIRDLPKPPPVTGTPRVTRFARYMDDLHKNHKGVFYSLLIVLGFIIITISAIPTFLWGAEYVFATGWGATMFGYLIGGALSLGGAICWICD